MPKTPNTYVDESNPGRVLEEKPQMSSRPGRKTWKDRSHHPEFPTPAQKNTRPPEVSERVWGLAEQWLEMGEAQFGKRPPVSKVEFSKRLDTRILADERLQRWLRISPERWQEVFPGVWNSGIEFVNDVLYRMLELFYENLTEDQKNTSALQFAFLNDEWDEWSYHAVTSVQVKWFKTNGHWSAPTLPKAVFDPATVGQPDDDAPCTDPMFEGMTWGEVRARSGEDRKFLTPRSDDGYDPSLREQVERTAEKFAELKSVMLANREDTMKETAK